jgi:hypothetical protein
MIPKGFMAASPTGPRPSWHFGGRAEGPLSEIWPAAITLFAISGITAPRDMLAVIVGGVILGAVALRERLKGRPF